ncbi:MAG: hypothetical protein EBZ77_11185, partial [Chitinophagia bacterium]|nr:hypothetical protein [Chitinophagia bacterium]
MGLRPRYIVMQCYGNEDIFFECAYSLLTLSRQYAGEESSLPEIWIYTDNPEWFHRFRNCPLPLHFEKLDAALLQQWRGQIQFVHRVKIELLLHFTQQRSGSILYLDTDMVFTHRLEALWSAIDAGQLCMHLYEGVVSARNNPIFRKLDRYLRTAPNKAVAGKNLQDVAMWNAGLLG